MKVDDEKIIRIDDLPCATCRQGGDDVTLEHILNDTVHCNFCDVPYAVLDLLGDGFASE